MEKISFRRLALVLAVLWTALHLPLLLGIRVLPGDALFEFYPMVYFNVHSLREGVAPWWNPYIFAGYPQIADPQAMLFSPLLMGWMLLRSEPTMPWFVIGALLHLYLGGISMLALLRRLNVNDVGALIGAAVFMAGGVAASRIQHVPILIVYSLIPLAMLCVMRLADSPTWIRSLALGAVASMLLVIPVQLTYFAGITLAGFAAAFAARRWRLWHPRSRIRYVGGLALAAAVSLVLAGPQLLFTYAFVSISNRPELSLAAATELSVSFSTVMTLLLPNALHNLRGTYTGPADPIETFYWIGALPLILSLSGAKRAWTDASHRRYLVFFLAIGITSLLFMMGSHTGFYEILYHALPGVKQFRRPSDAAYLLNLAMAFAVAISSSHVDLHSHRVRVILLGGTSVWLLLASATMRGEPQGWQMASIIAPTVSLAAMFLMRRRVTRANILVALTLIMVADFRAFGLNGEFNQRGDRTAKFIKNGAAGAISMALAPGGSHERSRTALLARIEAVDMPASWKNNVVLRGIPATQGYGPLRWAMWDRWYGPYADGNGPRPTTPYNPDPTSNLNRILGVRYVVTPLTADISAWRTPPLRQIHADANSQVLEIDALPRAYSPGEARLLNVRQEPSPEVFAAANLANTVFLTPRSPEEIEPLRHAIETCAGGFAGIVSAGMTNTHALLQVEAQAPAWVVLSDLDFPGWRASIDGVPANHYRANGLLRAICMPTGRHSLSFTFDPWRMVRLVIADADQWR